MQHVRYLPLGSPWSCPNVSYVHVLGVPGARGGTVLVDVRGVGWVPGGVYWVGIPGGY